MRSPELVLCIEERMRIMQEKLKEYKEGQGYSILLTHEILGLAEEIEVLCKNRLDYDTPIIWGIEMSTDRDICSLSYNEERSL